MYWTLYDTPHLIQHSCSFSAFILPSHANPYLHVYWAVLGVHLLISSKYRVLFSLKLWLYLRYFSLASSVTLLRVYNLDIHNLFVFASDFFSQIYLRSSLRSYVLVKLMKELCCKCIMIFWLYCATHTVWLRQLVLPSLSFFILPIYMFNYTCITHADVSQSV